ncbi:MAG: glycosyltransferase family 2 protein [Bacteroidales bacterium]|nr:glycosyltransferase family 2 protein [Bacteroidales bacterium]
MEHPEYSIVVPVYNSESTLEALFSRVKQVFETLGKSFEVVFVDDCSKDKSWEVLSGIKSVNPNLVVAIRLTRNYGQHNAVFCGFEYAKGDYIITLDDDLQVPPEEITKLIDKFKETDADLVYGYFGKKHHSVVRNVGSYFIKKSSRLLLQSPGEGSSFRLLSSELAKNLLKHNQHFLYIDELLLWYTGNIAFVQVEHQKRNISHSGYSTWKLMKLSINIIIHYTAVPLKIMTYGGFILSILSFFLAIRFIINKLIHDVPLGYTSLIVAILFSTSIIMLCLGVIGEYLTRIYKVQNKKPPYSIKKILR